MALYNCTLFSLYSALLSTLSGIFFTFVTPFRLCLLLLSATIHWNFYIYRHDCFYSILYHFQKILMQIEPVHGLHGVRQDFLYCSGISTGTVTCYSFYMFILEQPLLQGTAISSVKYGNVVWIASSTIMVP